MKIKLQTAVVLAASLVAFLPGCKSESSSTSTSFVVLDTTVINGDTWFLNRPIDIYFGSAIDFNSVSTSSVIFRSTETINLGVPVTGTYELIPDVQGRADYAIRFTPACPDNLEFDNGGLVPGTIGYELLLPTENSGGFTVVRDVDGRPLSAGLTRKFVTPALGETYFYDPLFTPAQITDVRVPTGLGLLSIESATFEVDFDQGIGPSPVNLGVNRIYVEYSDDDGLFLVPPQIVPGEWVVVNNCGESAELLFQVSGVLLPERNVRVVTTSDFEDLSGDKNNTGNLSPTVQLSSLADIYNNSSVNPDNIVYDQFIDDFSVGTGIDYSASLAQPLAEINQGEIMAAFTFPDNDGIEKVDFRLASSHLEINTTGTDVQTDDFGNSFTVAEGVMYTNDFTLDAGTSIRAFGDNPLIIYIAGDATIDGEIDASGYDANVADGLTFRPDIVVLGAEGACGGGKGGDASTTTDYSTSLGENGFGPFDSGSGFGSGGGSGGEGGYQQDRSFAAIFPGGVVLIPAEYLVAGGGGGGGFALTRTDAVFWDEWPSSSLPNSYDNAGPDLRSDRHTIFGVSGAIEPNTYFVGAEDGMRGSSMGKNTIEELPLAQAVRGYIDNGQDLGAVDTASFDPAQTGGSINDDERYGLAVSGPDGGSGGDSVFSVVDPGFGITNDFYGERFFWDGTAGVSPVNITGELLAPHAGSGGGGSGDIQTILRYLNDGNDQALPLASHYPDTAFPHGATQRYFRGAGGGGGGGQIQIHVMGHIILGASAVLKVNGGNGAGGDSTSGGTLDGSATQVSGSGGGSGGHLILSSASGLNLSAIDVGTAGDPTEPGAGDGTFLNSALPNYTMQAIGGRRGWSTSGLAETFGAGDGAPNNYDGNGSFHTGRGGAGASGVIQIHIPDPIADIAYHSSVDSEFKRYITRDVVGNPVFSDRQDEILALYAMPVPFTLKPFYSPQSQVQSVWIDTGLAGIRNPINGVGSFPNYGISGALDFDGLDFDGYVEGDGTTVTRLNAITDGVGGVGEVGDVGYIEGDFVIDANGFGVRIKLANLAIDDIWKFNPKLLIGCDFTAAGTSHEIISADLVSRFEDLTGENTTDLVIATLVPDGAITGDESFVIYKKFLGISSGDIKDKLPSSSSVRIQFQGADGVSQESLDPDLATITDWTGESSTSFDDLDGKRFIRYRVSFDIDALNQAGFNSLSRPALGYIKIPYGW
jgi:hypothetical protein